MATGVGVSWPKYYQYRMFLDRALYEDQVITMTTTTILHHHRLERRVATTSNSDLAGAKPRIINGSDAPKDRYTWFTRVITDAVDGTLGGCGGSLIAPGKKK